ncbi:helix-turn-helix domain-containing protein [Bacillus sp. JJ722]|uniref:helix-turn-helix domain-containing protein n=1 Tax=Bacillus sp. JJ722 TaxID=3122973 RepID=UPI0030005D39
MNEKLNDVNESEVKWYTKAETMHLLGISSSTVYHYYKQGKLTKIEDPHRLYKEVRYRKEDVEILLSYTNATKQKEMGPAEVAKRLGVTLQTVYKYIADGLIESKVIPFGDERHAHSISEESFQKARKALQNNKPTKARLKDYYNKKKDIALFQLFHSSSIGQARINRDQNQNWLFHLLTTGDMISYENGIKDYGLGAAYFIHESTVESKGHCQLNLPKSHNDFYKVIDYLYEFWGIENCRLRDIGEVVEIFVEAGFKPFNNSFQISNIQPYLKQGEWIVEEDSLIIKSSYRKTSIELPTDMLDKIKKQADEQHITMSMCIEQLLKKIL